MASWAKWSGVVLIIWTALCLRNDMMYFYWKPLVNAAAKGDSAPQFSL